MKKIVKFALATIPFGAMSLIGCGGGSSSVSTVKSVRLNGTATVPSGTPTKSVGRAASTDVPLPGATVKIYDVNKTGATLTGTPVKTTTTSLTDGTWAVTGLTPGDNYIVTITKVVTGGSTVTLQAYANTSSSTTAPTTVAVPVNLASTLATVIVIQAIQAEPTAGATNLSDIYSSYVVTVTTEQQAGTLPTVNLTNPQSYTTVTTQVAGNSLKDATYLDDGTDNSRRDLVNLMVSKTNMKVVTVLIVTDATGNVFDADYYEGALNADGTFSGTTKDGLYTIAGSVAGSAAHGTYSSIDKTLTGRWEANAAAGQTAGTPTYRGLGYLGSFTKAGSTGTEGIWAAFVSAAGKATMFVHDEARTNITHLERTAVVMGTVDTSGNITGDLVFPVVTTNGVLSGVDPAEGGTAIGTVGNSSLTNHTVSGSVDVTGAIANDAVTGTWSFSGLRNGSTYARSGTWSGITF